MDRFIIIMAISKFKVVKNVIVGTMRTKYVLKWLSNLNEDILS